VGKKTEEVFTFIELIVSQQVFVGGDLPGSFLSASD
jgi:hypothetical protein